MIQPSREMYTRFSSHDDRLPRMAPSSQLLYYDCLTPSVNSFSLDRNNIGCPLIHSIIVWIIKAFFEGVPREMEEAALIDGCSRWQAFYRISLPLAQPGLAASAILVFVYVWNEFLISYALTISTDTRMVTTGIYFSLKNFGINWGALTAGVTISLVPIIVFFLLLEKRFVQGLTAGATMG